MGLDLKVLVAKGLRVLSQGPQLGAASLGSQEERQGAGPGPREPGGHRAWGFVNFTDPAMWGFTTPFYKGENRGSESARDLSQATQRVKGRAKM